MGIPLMARGRIGLVVSVVLATTRGAAAQEDPCRDLLTHGIYDTVREYTSGQQQSEIDKQFCDVYSRYQRDQLGGGAQASYGLFSGSLSFSKDTVDAIGKSFCAHDASKSSSDSLVTKSQNLLNATAINAWQACVTSRQQRGLQSTWRFREEDQRYASVEVEYVPPAGGAAAIRVNRVVVSPAYGLRCSGQLLELQGKDIQPAHRYSLSCERFAYNDPKKVAGLQGLVLAEPASIEIDTAAGQLRADWKAIRPAPPRPVSTLPVGTIVPYLGKMSAAADVPSGWLLCDGSEVAASAYPELFAAIGTHYGKPVAQDNVKLPDLRGMFLRGEDRAAGRDKSVALRQYQDGSAGNGQGSVEDYSTALPKVAAFTTTTNGNHAHSLNLESTAGRQDGPVHNTAANPACCGSARPGTDAAGDHSHGVVGGDPETRPVNMAVNYLVKALAEAPALAAR